MKLKKLHLDATLLELSHEGEDLMRIASLHGKSNVKIRLKYIISPKRKAKETIFSTGE